MRISDWGSDVCSSDLPLAEQRLGDCLVARRGGLVRPDALDLGFEQRDAFVEFVHRQRIEWLADQRSEEHTSELQSLMRISYAVFCLKKKKRNTSQEPHKIHNILTTILLDTIRAH